MTNTKDEIERLRDVLYDIAMMSENHKCSTSYNAGEGDERPENIALANVRNIALLAIGKTVDDLYPKASTIIEMPRRPASAILDDLEALDSSFAGLRLEYPGTNQRAAPNVVPLKCPVCGAAIDHFEPWTEDEPEIARFSCNAIISGYRDHIEFEEECIGLFAGLEDDEEWDAAYEKTKLTASDWIIRKMAELEEKSRAEKS